MARRRSPRSVACVLDTTVDDVYAAARAVCQDDEVAVETTVRILVAAPTDQAEDLVARSAILAANRSPTYRHLEPGDRAAVVLARALGWKTDRIAAQLGTTPADIRARIGRGLRTLLPPPDFAVAASRGRGAHGS
jgi:DNA-directed RNA polymerase specialized sigma24 family protein